MSKNNRTKYTILGMLTIRPMSGYEIAQTIQNSISFFWSESQGQIYPNLNLCVESGLVKCIQDEKNKSKRNKKVYKITASGKKELITWLSTPLQPTLVRNELLLKLFFGTNNDKDANIKSIINYKNRTKALLTTYEELYAALINDHENTNHSKYWIITLNYGIAISKAELQWCDETIASFIN